MRFRRIIIPVLSSVLAASCSQEADLLSRDAESCTTVVAAGTGAVIELAGVPADITRALNPDLQNTELDSRTRVGVFVVRPQVWAEIERAAAEDDFAAAFCDRPLEGYGYMNVPCRVRNGKIVPEDGSSFRLPDDRQPDRTGVAIVLYAPYKPDLTLRRLLRRHEGMLIHLAKDQSGEQNELNSDIIFGIPAEGNPIYRLTRGEGEETVIAHRYNVELSLQHFCTRLSVEAKLQNTGTDGTLRFDSVSVSVVNPVRIYKYGPYLSHDARGLVFPANVDISHVNTDDIHMATWRDVELLPGETGETYYATCMVLPIQLHLSTAFRFTFYRDGEVCDIRMGGPDRDSRYLSGKSLRFPVNIRL